MKRCTALVVSLAPIFASLPAAAQSIPTPTMNIPEASSKPGFDLGFSTGFDYVTDAKCDLLRRSLSCTSTGTSAFSVPSTVMAQWDRVRVALTVPFVDLKGPGKISGVLGSPEIVASPTGPVSRRYGLGDVSLGAAAIVIREGKVIPRVELGGVVKLPTGKNGLGTGGTDYGAQLSFYRPLLTGVTTFGSLGYQWIRDTNSFDLHSGARATAGLDVTLWQRGRGRAARLSPEPVTRFSELFHHQPLSDLANHRRCGHTSLHHIALTRSSPNHGLGFRVVL